MKRILFYVVIAALCAVTNVSAQKMFASGKYSAMCSYYGETISGTITAHTASPESDKVVKNILSVIGLRPNFELRSANVPNAAAVIIKSKRYILYNPRFMTDINTVSGNNWAAISILAHEIGHHLNGHTLDKVGSRPATELEADEFSGFVLRRLGAKLADAQAAMGLIASMKGSHSHPPKKDRLTAIAAGWNNAGSVNDNTAVASTTTDINIKKPAVVAQPQLIKTSKTTAAIIKRAPAAKTASRQVAVKRNNNMVLADKYVACDVYFDDNPGGKYYITKKGDLVEVAKNNIYIIGRLAQSNKPGFTSMLSDKQYNYMYIGTGGVVVNGAGKKVGRLSMR